MSSRWNYSKNKPCNPFQSHTKFQPRWGSTMTCMHTMADARGAWWISHFKKGSIQVSRIKILNRGDCCGNRLRGAKIYVGHKVCDTINHPKQGQWTTHDCNIKGSFIKIKGVPRQYLHFCGIKVFGSGSGKKPVAGKVQ